MSAMIDILNQFIEGFSAYTKVHRLYCDEMLYNNTYNQHDQIQAVPNIKEIRHSMFLDLQKFFNKVVKDKPTKDDFASKDEVVARQYITQQLDSSESRKWNDTSRGRKFKGYPGKCTRLLALEQKIKETFLLDDAE